MVSEKKFSSNQKVLLSEQDVARKLGVSKKDIQSMITTGVLPAIALPGRNLISSVAIDNLLGKKDTADSGQLGHGYPIPNAIYYHQENDIVDSEEEIMREFTGNISVMRDGRYMVQVNLGKDESGKRKRESKSFKTKPEAERYLTQRLNELNGVFQKKLDANEAATVSADANANYTDKTFEEYATAILNRGIGKAVSRTIEGYRTSLVPVLEYIGNIKMVDIDRDRLINTFNKLSYRYGKVSLKKAFNTTKMLMEEAYYNEEIPKNPFVRLKMPPSQVRVVNYRDAYTDEEIALILKKAKGYCNKILYPMICVLECTGMRPSEMRAIEWANVDLEKKTVHIKNAIVTRFDTITDLRKKPKSTEEIGPTKSASGIRIVKLSNLAVQALIDWREELNKMPPAMKNSKFVFPSQTGSYRTESSNKCMVQRFVKWAGLKDMHFMLYRFRHTVCTRMFLAGLSINVVQQMLGDSTSNVVTKIYNHMTQEQSLVACGDYYDKRDLRDKEIHS